MPVNATATPIASKGESADKDTATYGTVGKYKITTGNFVLSIFQQYWNYGSWCMLSQTGVHLPLMLTGYNENTGEVYTDDENILNVTTYVMYGLAFQ